MEKIRWYVGILPAQSSVGALRFARWLHASAPECHQLHGVYGVGARPANSAAVAVGPDLSAQRETLLHFVRRFECEDAFTSLEALAGNPDVVLNAVVRERGGDAILVGRASNCDSQALVALGAVPRRVLRRTEVPVVVVPPDVPTAQFGGGPVVVAVTPHDDSSGAIHFARRLATTHGLQLHLVHVQPSAARTAPHEPGMDIGEVTKHTSEAETRRGIERWCREQGLVDPTLAVIGGDVATAVVEHARRLDAAMIVCGSRQTSLLERIISSSNGSTIAAHADRIVAVVPPTAQRRS